MDFDPRDRDSDVRDVEIPWVDAQGGGSDGRDSDGLRGRDDDTRDRDRNQPDRDPEDPRDVFVAALELPRGAEREIVLDGDHRYELNGDDSRTLATIGAFRVVRNVTSVNHATSPTRASQTFVICERTGSLHRFASTAVNAS